MDEIDILNGILESKIKYFIKNSYNCNDTYKLYFNNFITGELIDINIVYDDIINNINDINDIMYIFKNTLKTHIIIEFLDNFIHYIIKTNSSKKNNSLDLLHTIIDTELIEYVYSIKIDNMLEYVINNDDIRVSYFVNSTLYKPSTSFKIVLKMLKKRILRDKIIDYLKKKTEMYKSKKNIEYAMHITEHYVENKNKNDEYGINLIIIVYQLWYNGINNDKLIDLYKNKDTFLSHGYFILHQLLDHIFINMYDEKQLRIKELNKIKKIIYNEPSSSSQFIKIEEYIKNRLKCIKQIITNYSIISHLTNFYDLSVYWLNHKKNSDECDDILGCIQLFYRYNKFDLNNSNTKLIKNVFASNSITKNPNIRINYLMLFHTYINDVIANNEKIVAVSNFVNYEKNINTIILSSMSLFHYIKEAFNSDELYNMLYPMSLLSSILNSTIYNNDDYRFNFRDTINQKYFKEMIYNNLNNFQYIIDEILEGMIKINTEENGSNDESIIKDEIDDINNLNLYLNIFGLFIVKTSKYFSNIMLSDEIKNCVLNILVDFINKLATSAQSKYKIINKNKINFKPLELLEFLKSILFNLVINKSNEELVINLLSTNGNYTKDSISRLITILSKHSKIKNIDYNYLNFFNIKLTAKINELQQTEELEIPDELCDPIMDTLIEYPIMLPNNIIMDFEVIKRHLLTCETNPFNRDVLTLELLEEYNSKDEVKTKIDTFKTKIHEFKLSNNLI